MHPRALISPVLLLPTLLVALAGCGGGAPDGPPPRNVLVVSIDTLRADYLGCYGDASARTGTIDRLASEGVLYEAATAPTPITLPSHATLLTGVEPWRHGIRHNGIYRLEERFETLAERLSAEGFETAAVVGGYPLSAEYGLAQGFSKYDDAIPLSRSGGYHVPERRAAQVSDAALAWLAGRNDPARPFFLFLHYYDPHVPYEPPAEYMRPSPGGGAAEALEAYRGEIAYVDAQLGRVLDGLRDGGRLDRTLVIVTADHGEGLMQHGELTHGVFLYEELVRVPLILRYPAALPRGRRIAGVVALSDVAPSVAAALDLPQDPELDGRSLWAAARGTAGDPREAAYSESHFGRIEYGWAPLRSARTEQWKYIDAPEPELYELSGDAGETTNLLEDRPQVAERMRARLAAAFRETVEDAPQPIGEEELARLRSLGYLQGSAGVADSQALPDPKHKIRPFTQLQIASVELMQGRAAGAERRLASLVVEDPGNITVRVRLADARSAQGDLDGAEQALREALEISDERSSPQVLWGLAGLARRRGDHEEALQLYRRHQAIAPLSSRTVDRMVETLVAAGRSGEAEALAREWLASQPDSLGGWRTLARLLDGLDRDEEAQAAWQRVLALDPADSQARAKHPGGAAP